MIPAALREIGSRVDARSPRERVLLLLGSVAVLFLSMDSLALESVYRQKRALTLDVEAQTARLERLRQQSAWLDIAGDAEPPDERRALGGDLEDLARQVDARLARLLSPDRAGDVLAEVLAHENGLRLDAIDTRLTPFGPVEEGPEREGPSPRVNRHALDVELEGGYMDTLDYLRALESLPWRFFWSGIDFEVVDFPRASVRLQIYTLGRQGS